MRVKKFVFKKARFVRTTLFKIPELNGNEIFVVEGAADLGEEFIEAYEKAGLSGLTFEEIWHED